MVWDPWDMPEIEPKKKKKWIQLRLKTLKEMELEMPLKILMVALNGYSLGFMFPRPLHYLEVVCFYKHSCIASFHSGNLWFVQTNYTELLLCLPKYCKITPGLNGRKIQSISHDLRNDLPSTITPFPSSTHLLSLDLDPTAPFHSRTFLARGIWMSQVQRPSSYKILSWLKFYSFYSFCSMA